MGFRIWENHTESIGGEMNLSVLIAAFLAALIFVLITIIKFNLHPFLALLFGGIIMGGLSGMAPGKIAEGLSAGFGSTMESIGILIILGVILGEILHVTGCAEQIAALLLKKTGTKRAALAINMTGYIVSIPVFFDAAFIILVNLVKSISRKGKIPFATLVCALAVGLITTHAMVVPTPGPVAVAGTMGLNIGFFLLYSIIVSIPATLAGGIAYGKMLGRRPEFKDDFAQAFEDEETDSVALENSRDKQPSGQLGIFLIILPILIILVGTIITMVFPEKSVVYAFFAFIGNKNIALLIGVLASLFCLRKYLKESFDDLVTKATTQAGSILAITGAGGAFGQIITNSGIGKGLTNGMMGAVSGSTIVILLMAYAVSLVLRAAQGSTTVALVTTSAIFASVISGMPNVSPVLVAIAICAGGIGLSLPNDSGFWVINRFGRFSVKDTIKIYTAGGTIASVTAIICVVIISLFQGVLPGLF